MNKYQKLLELNDGFNLEELRTSYKKLVKIYHPDLFKTKKEKIKANRKMQKLNEAYQVLLEQLQNAEISTNTDTNEIFEPNDYNENNNINSELEKEETFEPDEADWLESLLASKCSYVILGIVITIISVLLSLE